MLVGTRTLFRIIDSSANHFSCSHSCILQYFGDYRGTVPDAGKGRPFDIEDHAKGIVEGWVNEQSLQPGDELEAIFFNNCRRWIADNGANGLNEAKAIKHITDRFKTSFYNGLKQITKFLCYIAIIPPVLSLAVGPKILGSAYDLVFVTFALPLFATILLPDMIRQLQRIRRMHMALSLSLSCSQGLLNHAEVEFCCADALSLAYRGKLGKAAMRMDCHRLSFWSSLNRSNVMDADRTLPETIIRTRAYAYRKHCAAHGIFATAATIFLVSIIYMLKHGVILPSNIPLDEFQQKLALGAALAVVLIFGFIRIHRCIDAYNFFCRRAGVKSFFLK